MSSDTIYSAIHAHARGALRHELIAYLRYARRRVCHPRKIDGNAKSF